MKRLENKVVVVTGAGEGIGQAAAELFAREGAQVVVAELDVGRGLSTLQRIRAEGGSAQFVPTDVTDESSVKEMVKQVQKTAGRIDLLYNNAGGSTNRDGPVTSLPIEEFHRVMGVDVLGTILCSRHVIPAMKRVGAGAIVNSCSVVGLMGIGGRDGYSAAKGAIAALTRSMAVEFAPDRIRVNAVAPTITRTARAMRVVEGNPELMALLESKHLLGLADPIDVAYAALYLLSAEARVVTGTILPVDSGVTIS